MVKFKTVVRTLKYTPLKIIRIPFMNQQPLLMKMTLHTTYMITAISLSTQWVANGHLFIPWSPVLYKILNQIAILQKKSSN